tara:strand:+ start:1046 stop:1276 length:231 start_codon:yes stop_codon:yes gene_type:complete
LLDFEEGAGNGPFFFLMKITCTRGVMASGKALEAGQTYEVSDKDGALLIGMGKAVEATAEEPKPKRTRKAKTDGAS